MFRLSESTFKYEKGLLKELTNYVIDSLGGVYPEMERNIKTVGYFIQVVYKLNNFFVTRYNKS